MPLTIGQTTPAIQDQVAASNKNMGSKDIFLKLLVAQMKNQNPLKPTDPTKMTSQLSQFNMVEQQIDTNKKLTDLVNASSNASSANSFAAGYLGKTATSGVDKVTYSGTPTSFDLNIDGVATSSSISFKDSSGVIVKTLNLQGGSGISKITWDGTDNTGALAPQGDYTVSVSAFDSAGNAVAANAQTSGLVQAITMGASGTDLVIGGVHVPMSKIIEVRL